MSTVDYAAVSALRTAFEDQAAALWSATHYDADGSDAAHLAFVSVACTTAADALFDVMNAAKSYLDDADALAVIDGWLPPCAGAA